MGITFFQTTRFKIKNIHFIKNIKYRSYQKYQIFMLQEISKNIKYSCYRQYQKVIGKFHISKYIKIITDMIFYECLRYKAHSLALATTDIGNERNLAWPLQWFSRPQHPIAPRPLSTMCLYQGKLNKLLVCQFFLANFKLNTVLHSGFVFLVPKPWVLAGFFFALLQDK